MKTRILLPLAMLLFLLPIYLKANPIIELDSLERSTLWKPGDDSAASYRIPAICILDDGTLIAVADRRNEHIYDLPANIDLVLKRSTDGGHTWSETVLIADGNKEHGYGDALLVSEGQTVHLLYVGANGFWQSTPKQRIRTYYRRSDDGGISWTEQRDLTAELYPEEWPGAFIGSGRGIVTSKGRIAMVLCVRKTPVWGDAVDNHMLYSDDKGETWHVGSKARHNGDEAKIVELKDGRLLISSRNREEYSARSYMISDNDGASWSPVETWNELKGNACNAAILRYTHADGKISYFHSLPADPKRQMLTLYRSDDEAKSWQAVAIIHKGPAAYSELVQMPDGAVGILYEGDETPNPYTIYFTKYYPEELEKSRKP